MRLFSKRTHLFSDATGNARERKVLFAHRGEHRDAERNDIGKFGFDEPIDRSAHHLKAADRMHGDHVGPRTCCARGSPIYLMRDIVEFQIEEHVEPKILERLHDRRSFLIVECHAHLEPGGLALKSMSERKCFICSAIERYDDALGFGQHFEV